MKKRYLYSAEEVPKSKREFWYEIKEDFMYLTKDKKEVVFVDIMTDEECMRTSDENGYTIEFQDSSDNSSSAVFTEVYRLKFNEFLKIANKLRKDIWIN